MDSALSTIVRVRVQQEKKNQIDVLGDKASSRHQKVESYTEMAVLRVYSLVVSMSSIHGKHIAYFHDQYESLENAACAQH